LGINGMHIVIVIEDPGGDGKNERPKNMAMDVDYAQLAAGIALL